MANVQTDALPSVATIAVGDTFVGNDASSGSTAQFTLPAFDARYATFAGTNTFAATNRFKAGGFNDSSIELGGASFGFAQYNTDFILVQTGANKVGAAFNGTQSAAGGIGVGFNQTFWWSNNGDPSGRDTALMRAAAGVVEVNDGTAGTGHGCAINFPRTAADADAPAPASGATLYSKQVIGKNALFVRFPTGAVQQLAIEL